MSDSIFSMTPIERALDVATYFGQIDGAHHKAWVIDQMVRALTDCPIVKATAEDSRGNPYEYETFGESEAYKKLIADYKMGKDGPDTYSWDVGIVP